MTAAATYTSRSINERRARRSKADMEALRETLREVVAADAPMTVRQVFYAMVSRGAIAKTEAEYHGTVVRLLLELRRSGDIDYGDIADSTRWMRRPDTCSGIDGALLTTAHFYRRRLWDDQDSYVEVWLEKDALAGVLYTVTEEWDVPLMVTRGYSSETFLHDAAEAIEAQGKPAHLYYFGDHDPSGLNIPQVVERRLRDFAPGADIEFTRVAVTPEQIVEWNLPVRPTKRTDTRARNFVGGSVEVDAIPPTQLRQLVRECIEQHVDEAQLFLVQVAEESERDLFRKLARRGADAIREWVDGPAPGHVT